MLASLRTKPETTDVDRIAATREVAEDRGPVRWGRDGRRTARCGGRAGTCPGASRRTRPAGSVDGEAVLDAGSRVAPFVSCLCPTLWPEALPLLSAGGEH